MKLVVPYICELQGLDDRLVRLADFLGIPCQTFALANSAEHVKFLEDSVPDECTYFVLNPQVMKEWFGGNGIPAGMAPFLLSRFTHLLVHGLRVDPFDSSLVAALSGGRLKSVVPVAGEDSAYVIDAGSKDVCEAFAGLSFGPANPANDHVLSPVQSLDTSDKAVRQLISIGGLPFMAAVKAEGAEVFFVASEDVVDLNTEVGQAPLAEYFSRLLPQAMALRCAAGDECWRSSRAYASIIIDDPLLRKSYGFLNFESLLRLAKQHNFHTTIAFIPHNFRRSSSRITRMFKENTARLSICFHGNDHTQGEFASTDEALLNALIRNAEERMKAHDETTGLLCDRVMVFPQGGFSVPAMKALKAHNFYAAVNSIPTPKHQQIRLKISEVAQPAVLRYENFPLFVRRPIRFTLKHDIAFNLFFGRPVLIVEHHELFEHPEQLVEIADRINSVAPEVRWANLATVVSNSILTRREPDGTYHVRAYSGTVRISNESGATRRYSIEWVGSRDGASVKEVLMDGVHCSGFANDGFGFRLAVELPSGSSRTCSLVNQDDQAVVRNLGSRWKARAFLRRRLSELRDNYLSKNKGILTAAKAFQQRFLKV